MLLEKRIKALKNHGFDKLVWINNNKFRMQRSPSHPMSTKRDKKRNETRHVYIDRLQCYVCKKDTWMLHQGRIYKYGPVCEDKGDCWSLLHSRSMRNCINSGQFKLMFTKEHPATDQGYLYWRESIRDENDKPVRHKFFIHRVVAEEKIGRPLTKADHVHHIDMDKKNNHPDNLWVCNSSEHKLIHWSFNNMCAELMNNFNKYSGIKFNKETSKYYLKSLT